MAEAGVLPPSSGLMYAVCFKVAMIVIQNQSKNGSFQPTSEMMLTFCSFYNKHFKDFVIVHDLDFRILLVVTNSKYDTRDIFNISSYALSIAVVHFFSQHRKNLSW